MKIQLPFQTTLRNQTQVELDGMQPQEQEAVRALLNTVILEGETYPQNRPLSEVEFAAYWMSQDAFVVRDTSKKPKTPVVGAFYLKPNFPGRCSHICNAGFIVQPRWRGQGMGRLMGEAMLKLAAQKGYSAVMFNLVFATNIPSIRLWESLGFETIGRISGAVQLSGGRVSDALMMYRSLSDLV